MYVFHTNKFLQVLVTALKFFLNSGSEDEDAEEDDSDSEIDKVILHDMTDSI